MKKIKKCVIPAAWFWTRFLPATKALPKEMFPLIDKPVMQYLVEEAVEAWCEDIIIITWRGKRAIEDHFDANFELETLLENSGKKNKLKEIKRLNTIANISYIRQPYPRWDWDAILRARNIIWEDPFLVLFWDDLIENEISASRQLIEAYYRKWAPIIWTVLVEEDDISSYWILERTYSDNSLFWVSKFLEKPKKWDTKSRHWVMWKYVLTSDVFNYLEEASLDKDKKEIRLADAFCLMLKEKDIYWLDTKWIRYDTWSKLWFLKATVSLALKREDLNKEFKKFLSSLI